MGKSKMNAARMGSQGPEVVAPEVLMDLMKPHIDSFDYFVDRDKPVISRPMKDQKDGALSLDQRLLPAECRMGGFSYRGTLTADLCIQYSGGNVIRSSMSFGRMPIMVKSSLCHLRGLDGRKMITNKEEAMEMGGYFISNGIERLIRLLIIQKRNLVVGVKRATFRNRGSAYSDKAVMIRLRKQEFLIPIGLILKALVDTTEREIYEQLISVQSEHDKSAKGVVGSQFISQRARIILEEAQRLNLFTRIQCLQYLGERFKHLLDVPASYSFAKVGEKILEDYILVNLDSPRDKFNMIIFMLHKLFALADGLAAPDNADALQHHEILLPGHLLTMFVKERMQEWLYRAKALLVKEMEEKPAFNLQDSSQVHKIIEKSPASDVSKKVEYLLATGNLVSPSGLDLQQASGFTLVAEKLNFLRYISHFRSVHRGAFFATLRTTTVRKLLPESWGFMCPVHTPDGSPCGLLNHLTAACIISTDLDARGVIKNPLKIRKAITSELVSLGMLPSVLSMARVAPPDFLTVHLDGRIIGHMRTLDIPGAVGHLRHCKLAKVLDIPVDLEVAYVPCTSGGAYPGLYLFSTPGRLLRPVKSLSSQHKGELELIGPYEQAYMEIRCPDGTDGGTAGISAYASHEETHALAMLSVVASLTPWSDHNQSPRNMYQCQV
ncbi:hypothetical protein R1sor_006402 [Riccia sorocarpa]|uniref:DNA-directed RNA polymerase n=1 Tax=Riccia sorocarpa TaxID=122646 RepID=A0ABD3HPK1_9MARC